MKLIKFISLVCAVGLCGLFAGPNRAFAEATESEDVPPVEHASFHQLVFADEDLSILNNLYPSGGDSGFHSHQHDMFYVVIQPGDGTRVQKSGEALAPARNAAMGAAAFGGLGGQRLVQRVVNGDKSDAQFIVVQLHRTTPHGSRVSSRETSQGYIQIVDNARRRLMALRGNMRPQFG